MTVLEWLEFARDGRRGAGPKRCVGELNVGFCGSVAREVERLLHGRWEYPEVFFAVENVMRGRRTPEEAAREMEA